ncbi:MAG: hypothetical protein WC791_03935 [Candidatus Paceibacterota bacterium]|jgi:hypothetical protein
MEKINKVGNKKTILLGSILILSIVVISENPLFFGFCKNISSWYGGIEYCVDNNVLPEYVRQIGGFLSLSLLPLSLITYWMKEQAFRAWWNFASNWVVLIIFATFIFEIMGDGGSLNMGGGFEILVLGILYTIMIVGSIVKIVRTYQKTR